MKNMRNGIRFLMTIAVIAIALTLALPVYASEVQEGYGNEWVYDEAQVISDETEAYIKNLNENVFAVYANRPQLAIMIINDLPYNMDQYKLDTFNDYGVGTANENCGMLFIFAINDREYGLEIGDGFVEGSMLRADLETDFVTEEMKNCLRAEDYDAAVMMIVQYLEGLMFDQENGVYAQKEADQLAGDQNRANMVDSMIVDIGVVAYTDECAQAIEAARKEYNNLSARAKEFVAHYDRLVMCEQQYEELQREAELEMLKKIGLGLCIVCPIAGIIALCVILIKKKLRKDKIDEMCNRCYKHLRMADVTEDAVKEKIDKEYGEYGAQDIEDEFMDILYQMYIDKQIAVIDAMADHMKYDSDMYISELNRVNDQLAFERCLLTDLAILIANVDERQRQKEELRELNTQKVAEFLNANRHRVSDGEIWIKVRNAMHQTFDNFATEVRTAKLEAYFTEQLDSLGFEKEFDKFLNANQDKIGRDFNRNKLYNEMCATNNYRSYHYGSRMDRIWMMHMLMSHQERQKQNRLDQERRDREAAERRRREAQRRAQQQSISSRNSSFGGGFGGGRSSGGGMRGGW